MALEHIRQGDKAAGIGELQAAVQICPHDPATVGNLGLAYLDSKDYAAALSNLRRAADLAPRDASILFALFQAQLGLHRFEESEATAHRILILSPEVPEVFNRLAGVQAEAGDYAHAAENFARSLALNPADPTTRYNLGLAYFKTGNVDRAAEVLEPLDTSSSGAVVENLLGDVYQKAGDSAKALAALKKSAEMQPRNEDYCIDYIIELLRCRSYGAAQILAENGVSQFPASLQMKLAYAIALFGLEQFSKAHSIATQTAAEFPESELALRVAVFSAEASRDELEQAELLVRKYLRTHANDSTPYYLLGRMGLVENQPAKAIPLLAESAALNPKSADTWLELGKAHELAGEKAQAAHCYREAIRLKPDMSDAWYRLARMLRQLGRNEEAEQALLKFRELHSRENVQSGLAGLLNELH